MDPRAFCSGGDVGLLLSLVFLCSVFCVVASMATAPLGSDGPMLERPVSVLSTRPTSASSSVLWTDGSILLESGPVDSSFRSVGHMRDVHRGA